MGTAGTDQLRIRPQIPQLRTRHQEPLLVTGSRRPGIDGQPGPPALPALPALPGRRQQQGTCGVLLRARESGKPMALVSQPDRPVMRDNDGTKSAPRRRADNGGTVRVLPATVDDTAL